MKFSSKKFSNCALLQAHMIADLYIQGRAAAAARPMLYISITGQPQSAFFCMGQPPAGWEMSLQMLLYRTPCSRRVSRWDPPDGNTYDTIRYDTSEYINVRLKADE